MNIARNAPCPCGSGKKYKRCCLPGREPATAVPLPTVEDMLDEVRQRARAGNFEAARQLVRRATRQFPRNAATWALACGVEMRLQNFEQAKTFIRRALKLEPDNPVHLYNYATTLAQTWEQEAAVRAFRKALKLKPDFYQAYNNLGNTLRDLGREREAKECFEKVFQSPVRDLSTLGAILLSMQLFVVDEHDSFYQMHRALAEKIQALVPADTPRRVSVSRRPGNRIRLGYLSPRFSREIVGNFFRPVFEHHSRERFELYLYSATPRPDDLTEYFRAESDAWRDVTRLSDRELCQRIVEDEIDILVDLAGHAPESRITAVACKPAPVQVSMLDYFDTTGLDAMDYYVTDRDSTPPDSEQRFIEELIVLEHPRLVYRAPDYAPEPQLRNETAPGFVFGSFNRHHKITERVIELWSRLLLAVPESTLLLKSAAFASKDVQQAYRERFDKHGVAGKRIIFRGRTPHEEMLAEYGDIDVALDTFPYNGGLTTCEALWMGTPVIALRGNRIISRQSACMLDSVGLPGFVADREEEFVAIGQYWANHRAELHDLRRGLRSRMARSPLTDAAGHTREIEENFTRIWNRYIEEHTE